jgi:hypothetical protein
MLTRLKLQSTNRPIDVLNYWYKGGDMLLDPPYQRGDVWGTKRRVNLIRSLMLGIPIPSIIINDRFAAGWSDSLSCVVIDGKQRITSILLFLNDKLEVPAEWFGYPQGMLKFSQLPTPTQRGFRMHTLGFCEGQLDTLESEVEVFNLINFGGVAQGDSDTPDGITL